MMTMTTKFDPARLVQLDFNGPSQRFAMTELQPLAAALAAHVLTEATSVLYTQQGDQIYVFRTSHFSLYNVMQGVIDGQPWMATFCAVCNAGMSFSPVVNGQTLEFYGVGYYDAMTLLADRQTGSYWDHLTGECLYGQYLGTTLPQLTTMTHSTAGQVIKQAPDAQFVVTALTPDKVQFEAFAEALRVAPEPQWFPQIMSTLDAEDKRLPRFEMGLGVWAPGAARFYPFTTLHANDNIVFDEFAGQRLLVYVDPETTNPLALFTDATSGVWRHDVLVLNNGQTLHNGVLQQRGDLIPISRPLQLFQRWYSFAITFPDCEVYPTYLRAKSG